jgi:hypothetical protein
MSTNGCHLTSFLSIPLRLSVFLLVFLNNSQNSEIVSFVYLIMSPVHSARNLGVIFDLNLTFSQHLSAVSESCFYHIRDLRRIRNTFGHILQPILL